MSGKPLATIWIPSYNHARFLPAAIESLQRQTYAPLEIVIVDDGSTDGSLEIARDFAARDERIRVHTHPGHANRGISETVNAAFAYANGVYVGGLPSDDILFPDSVERRVAALEANENAGFAYGVVEMLTEHGERTGETIGVGPPALAQLEGTSDPLATLLLHNYIPGMSELHRRDVFERLGTHEPSLVYSDWEHAIRLVASVAPTFLGGEPVAGHRRHERSTSLAAERSADLERKLALFISLESKIASLGGRMREPRIRALVSLQTAWYARSLGREADAVEAVRRAFTHDPTIAADRAYLLWWLSSKERPAGAAWAQRGLARPWQSIDAILTDGLRADHLGCWFVEVAREKLRPRERDALAWDVVANELEAVDSRRGAPLIFLACALRALLRPNLLRLKGFVRALLVSASLWRVFKALRARLMMFAGLGELPAA